MQPLRHQSTRIRIQYTTEDGGTFGFLSSNYNSYTTQLLSQTCLFFLESPIYKIRIQYTIS